MARKKAIYKRTYTGLFKKARAKASALQYPKFDVGDVVRVVDDILKIDERITASSDGYIGEQVRRRMRYKYLSQKSTRGRIVEIRVADIYVKFQVKDKWYRERYGLDKPILLRKQMLKKLKKKAK